MTLYRPSALSGRVRCQGARGGTVAAQLAGVPVPQFA